MRDAARTTEAVCLGEAIHPRMVESLLGLWTWSMPPTRCKLAILDEVYEWVRLHRGQPHRSLTPGVRNELRALAAMSIYFHADLSMEWHEWAFMTDPSFTGYGVLGTRATVQELRQASASAAFGSSSTSAERSS